MEDVSLLAIVPLEVIGHLFSLQFKEFIIGGEDYVYGDLLITYVHVSRVCSVFYNLLKEVVDRQIKDWRHLCWQMRHYSQIPSYIPVDDAYLALARGEIFYRASVCETQKEIERFRQVHNILYRVKKSGRVYTQYVGIKKLRKIKIQDKAVRQQYHALLDKQEAMTSRQKHLYKKTLEVARVYIDKHRREEAKMLGKVWLSISSKNVF